MLVESIRNFTRLHPKIAAGLGLVPLLVAGMILTRDMSGPASVAAPVADYVDEETGELSQRSTAELPPLLGKSGRPTVVRAVFLTASTVDACFPAYYEKYTDEMKAKIKGMKSGPGPGIRPAYEMVRAGTLVRKPSPGSSWVSATSTEGNALLKKIYQPDPTKPPLKLCTPDMK